MGARAAADTAIVSLSRARVCQGSKIWNSHPNSQKIEANPPRFLPSRDLYCKKLEYELGYLILVTFGFILKGYSSDLIN